MTKLTRAQLALRAKWTTALRSGRYQQGRGQLRRSGEYCCLGVLCDVSGLGSWGAAQFGDDDEYTALDGRGGAYLPPVTVKDATGMETDILEVVLPEMNDEWLDDFATIADAIDLDTLMRQDGCL